MKYRRARAGDFLAIAALDRRAWRQNRHAEYIPDGEHVWRIWCEHALVYCAIEPADNGSSDADAVIAAILAFPTEGGPYWVHKVFVDEAHRGQGVGSRLFDLLLVEIDRMGVAAALTVDPINEAAQALYRSWGFCEAQFVKGYYRHYEDRYVLTRPARSPVGEDTVRQSVPGQPHRP